MGVLHWMVKTPDYNDRRTISGVTRTPQQELNYRIRKALGIMLVNVVLGVVAGIIFSNLELDTEWRGREERARLTTELTTAFNINVSGANWTALVSTLGADPAQLAADLEAYQQGNVRDSGGANWDRTGGMFFAFTVCTTIGYGSFAPVTEGGRVFTVICAWSRRHVPALSRPAIPCAHAPQCARDDARAARAPATHPQRWRCLR